MGHIGYKPFENDQSSFIINEVYDHLDNYFDIKNSKDEEFYDELRGAAAVMLCVSKTGSAPSLKIIERAMECYKILLDDKEWFEDWTEPQKAKRLVRKEYNSIKGLKDVAYF